MTNVTLFFRAVGGYSRMTQSCAMTLVMRHDSRHTGGERRLGVGGRESSLQPRRLVTG